MSEQFDEIRAFDDDEVNATLLSLLNDVEFLQFIAQYQFPTLNRFLPKFVQSRLRKKLHSKFSAINDVNAWQASIAPMVENMMGKTVSRFKVSGLEYLDSQQHYVFISNHRDIAMDPLLVNYALLKAGLQTSKIAIGDNLLKRDFVAKLMRLNKSFVVQRSVQGRKEKLQSVTNLSSYIHECVKLGQNIWIAQKEGRAKDGVDQTDTAVLKMLHMAGRKLGWEFNTSLNFLNIVPVSISYEWDPCDVDKARELVAVKTLGKYEKSPDEDFQSIVKGLAGNKGKVALHFSQPIKLHSNNAEHWSDAIDANIYSGYELFPNNQLAYDLIEKAKGKIEQMEMEKWIKLNPTRYGTLDTESLGQLITYYAQPILSKKAFSKCLADDGESL